ncbi:hypothetical protein [Oceanicella sp. SM1341]|uniref:hypothetical protein n=1 Tax=Oceanicella sp. SM1341 TaxID=1548889 RepID=UPI000E4BDF65|nr:hypothetical protein [Oceanicella sp. SM1341]
MAMKIEGISYKDKIAEMLRDRELLDVLIEDIQKFEIFKNMLRFLISPPRPSEVYVQYLSPQADYPVNAGNRIDAHVRDLLRNGGSDDPRLWGGIIQLLTVKLKRDFDDSIIPAFFKRPAFLAHHEKKARALARSKMGSPRTVARNLGVKNVAKLEELMIAAFLKRDSVAEGLARELSRAERMQLDGPALVKSLRGGGTPAPRKQPDTSDRKLEKCGFTRTSDPRLKDLVADLAESYMARDRVLVTAAFKRITAIEAPKTSAGKAMGLDALLKAMKTAKVIG